MSISKTVVVPYVSSMIMILNDFTAKGQNYNQMTGESVPVSGPEKRRMSISVDLYMGDEKIATRPIDYKVDAQKATPGNKGISPLDEVLLPEIAEAFASSIKTFLDAKIPEYEEEDAEEQEKGGVVTLRPNAIVVNLPYNKPELCSVRAIIGVYEDADCKIQIPNSDFLVEFIYDVGIKQMVLRDPNATQEQVNEVRAKVPRLLDMTDLFSSPAVQQNAYLVVKGIVTDMKKTINMFEGMDVDVVMSKFDVPSPK